MNDAPPEKWGIFAIIRGCRANGERMGIMGYLM